MNNKLISSITKSLKHNLQPAALEAPDLLHQLIKLNQAQALTVEAVMSMGPKIDRAMVEAERISDQSRRIKERCKKVSPLPHPGVPLGY